METRLKTYPDSWDDSYPVRTVDLASAGWHYVGPKDRVYCHTCRGAVYNWEAKDSALDEHLRHFPKCTLAQSLSYKLNRSGVSEEEDVMKSVAARAMLQTGLYDEMEIRTAYTRMKREGIVNPSTNELLDALWAEDEEKIPPPPHHPLLPPPPPLPSEVVAMQLENARLKATRACKMCKDREASVLFMPCDHMACCRECSAQLTHCPICLWFILKSMNVYRA
jgi:hypothetical protein